MSPDGPPSTQHPKPPRVLACVLCQQRKVKCDRRFPCANCVRSKTQCVPATLAQRQRKRRFPERHLLDRIRKYETLLIQHGIPFEPLHKDPIQQKAPSDAENGVASEDEQPTAAELGSSTLSTADTITSDRDRKAKSFWHAMSLGFRDNDHRSDSSEDEVRETVVKNAWDQTVEKNDHWQLLFGSPGSSVDLSTLHPGPVQIFKLWQIYLDNINPLLKVTHTPSLQSRIIEAASDVTIIDPTLEALMFSIYCVAVLSLAAGDCQKAFGTSRDDMLGRYQLGCQQALWACGLLRTSDRDCLTAFYLYLISLKPGTVPQSISSMLGVAIRIAKRMGIHLESSLEKCTHFEAEMRRRLWWSLVLFDKRVSELASAKTTTLDPFWDCRIPLNVNDSDLRSEMKEPPAIQGKSSEALFVVVRSEVGNCLRHTRLHLDFNFPTLKAFYTLPQNYPPPDSGESELIKLEQMLENRYFKSCDPENPMHFMTMWFTRAFLAKCRLMEHNASLSSSAEHRTDAQHDAATFYAMRVLECDTKIMTSPLTRGFVWQNFHYFPFPAYFQIAQDLRRRPQAGYARKAWDVLSDSYQAWFDFHHSVSGKDNLGNPFYRIFAKIITQAWDAYEAASNRSENGDILTPPKIIASIRSTEKRAEGDINNISTPEQHNLAAIGMDIDNFPTQTPMTITDQSMLFDAMGMQSDLPTMGPQMFSGMPTESPLDAYRMNRFDWNTFGGWPHWGG